MNTTPDTKLFTGSGLQNMRDYLRKRLKADHDTRMARLDTTEAYIPVLNAVLILRVGKQKASAL